MKAFGPFHTHRAVFAAEINRLCSLELTAEQVGNRVKSRDYKSLTLALPAGTKHRAPTPEELAAKQLSSNTTVQMGATTKSSSWGVSRERREN
jgi:hypothetical protein